MIVSFTGSHGVGKTTSVFEKARELKILHPNKTVTALTENAKHSPFKINKETSKRSQNWIFTNQLQQELYLSAHYDIVVGDRTILDAVAYTVTANMLPLAESMFNMAVEHFDIYDEIYFKTIAKNEYFYADGNRDSEDRVFRQNIENSLLFLYQRMMDKGYLDESKFHLI